MKNWETPEKTGRVRKYGLVKHDTFSTQCGISKSSKMRTILPATIHLYSLEKKKIKKRNIYY